MKSVLFSLQNFITQNDTTGMGRMAPLMTTFVEELTEELSAKDEAAMMIYMSQIGEVIAWIGHGNNDALPENLRPFAEAVQPNASSRVERDSSPDSDQPSGERGLGDSYVLAATPED